LRVVYRQKQLAEQAKQLPDPLSCRISRIIGRAVSKWLPGSPVDQSPFSFSYWAGERIACICGWVCWWRL